jgi:hypothetical protein
MEDELLNSPIGDLTPIDLIFIPAVNFVQSHKLLGQLAAVAELPDDSAIEFHLINLTVLHIGRAGRIRTVEILVLPRSNADRPRSAHVDKRVIKVSIVVEDLNAGPRPLVPQALMKLPFLSNFTTLLLLYPSET